MEARAVSQHVFEQTMSKCKNAFNKSEFSAFNQDKCQNVLFLIIYKGESPRFGVTFGVRNDNEAFCPFSAPFAYIEPVKPNLTVSNFEDAVEALEHFFDENGYKRATIILPPSFYDKNVIESWVQIFLRRGWLPEYIDLSFGFNIKAVRDNYESHLKYNGKKNLRIALESGLNLKECRTLEEKKEAYRVIQVNRSSKGYPLRMTEEQVLGTMEIVPSNMFLVESQGENVAAALVYDVTDKIAQVIYWGDIPGHSEKKSVNFLAHELIRVYGDRGFEYLDIGPSTEEGIPNYGLCDFKDSIGCERSAKFRIYKTFNESRNNQTIKCDIEEINNNTKKVLGNQELVTSEEERMVEKLRERNLERVNSESGKVLPKNTIYTRVIKRLLDILISLPAFLLLLPINIVFGICTFFDVGRPIFYRQTRCGINGTRFTLTKFRNMTNETDEEGRLLPAAQRVTKFGKIMRKYSLDELQNFWNVLKGDMSIIGPRPIPVNYESRMSERHKARDAVRPGLECPRVIKLAEEGLSAYHIQFENDIWYVENVSFAIDIKMIFLLIKMVFDRKTRGTQAVGGSYFVGYDDDGKAVSLKAAKLKYEKGN